MKAAPEILVAICPSNTFISAAKYLSPSLRTKQLFGVLAIAMKLKKVACKRFIIPRTKKVLRKKSFCVCVKLQSNQR